VRRLFLVLALSVAGVTLGATPTLAAGPGTLPPQLQVPEGHRLALNTLGKGVQIYDCKDGTWTFRAPAAAILKGGRTIALHYAGPTWQSIADGSDVKAAVKANVPARDPGKNIPLLLLQATEHSGTPGVFADVAFIQRLKTRGGVAPNGGTCDPARDTSVGVPYSANYRFWVPA
jgi:hypothetical protein